jgi:hypothetical protein
MKPGMAVLARTSSNNNVQEFTLLLIYFSTDNIKLLFMLF